MHRLNNGLINYWPIENHVNDTVGGANMYNGVNVEFVKDRFGNPNSAIRFSDGYYQVPSGVYFKGDFTISLWLKINLLVPNSRILAFSRDNYDYVLLILYQYSSNYPFKPQLTIGSSYSSNIIAPFDLLRGQWMHLIFTLSGTTGSFYINGLLVDQSNVMFIPRNNSRTSNFIGKDGYYSDYGNFWSDLDDLRIYDRALSQTEIYDLLCCSSVFNSTNSISNSTNKPSVTNQTSNFKYPYS